MNANSIPIANVVVLGVLLITGIIVVAAVIGSILGRPVDAQAYGLVQQFVTATIALFGGLQWGEARANARLLSSMGQQNVQN